MRDFTIDILWSKIQMAVAAIGGWLGYFLGGMDGLMIALLVFMVLDYITGVMCAIADKKPFFVCRVQGHLQESLDPDAGRAGAHR